MSRWFRHYAGMCSDPKFGGIARRARVARDRVVFVFAFILESAAEQNDGGSFPWDADAVADLLNCDTEDIDRVYAELAAAGLIAELRVTKWASRQYEDRTNAERQARYKEKKRAGNAPVTEGECVTNGPHSTETETETEEEKKEICAPVALLPAAREPKANLKKEFEVFYTGYPRKKARDDAERAFVKVRRTTEFETIMDGVEKLRRANIEPQFIPYPASWLRSGQWADDYGESVKPGDVPTVLVPEHKTQEEADAWWASRFANRAGAA